VDVLLQKLGQWTEFSVADRAAIVRLADPNGERRVSRHEQIIREGDSPKKVFLILEGWAFRYKTLADGKRQIVALLLPGDLCDIDVFILERMDHSIQMACDGLVTEIRVSDMLQIVEQRPAVARALWWATLVDEAILREWLANIGAREAFARVAHLFCELFTRATAVGLVQDDQVRVPLTQENIGDLLGLTPVHINRMLRQLRERALMTFDRYNLTVLDFAGLKQAAQFDGGYLHVKSGPRPFSV
jgi:CRP-like cAMP-binding protein